MKLDGKWYNCDATAESWIPKVSTSMGAGPFFAFSDQLVGYKVRLSDQYPVCKKSYYVNPIGTVKNLNGDEFYNAVCKGFDKNQEWSFVIVKSVEETKLHNQLQRLANVYHCSVYYYSMNLSDEKTGILVTKKDVFG